MSIEKEVLESFLRGIGVTPTEALLAAISPFQQEDKEDGPKMRSVEEDME